MIKIIPGRSLVIVVTHKHKLEYMRDEKGDDRLGRIRQQLPLYGIPQQSIFAFENYTTKNHKEYVTRDIEILKFLLQALDACDRNISHLERMKGEKIIEKPAPRSRLKPEVQSLFTRVFARIDQVESIAKLAPTPATATPEPQNQGWGCALM